MQDWIARLRPQLSGLPDRAKDGDAVERDPEVGEQPGHGDENGSDSEHHAKPVEIARGLPPFEATPDKNGDGHARRDRDSERRQDVRGLRVEVVLIDHTGQKDDRARGKPDSRDPGRRSAWEAVDEQEDHHQGHEREWEVRKDEDPARSPLEALARDVVELRRRGSLVRHEDLRRDDDEERPDDEHFAGETAALAGGRCGDHEALARTFCSK
jgi:hypothetical protein